MGDAALAGLDADGASEDGELIYMDSKPFSLSAVVCSLEAKWLFQILTIYKFHICLGLLQNGSRKPMMYIYEVFRA